MVVGTDPLHHLTILAKLDRIRDCRAAKSLIDIALWDLRGKLLGEPVWRLLGGGPAQPVPLTWVAHGNTREAQVEESKRMVLDRGYRGLKLKVWRRSDEDVALVRDVRDAVGDDLAIYVDANSKYTEFEARTILSKIADYRVDFIEDPCRSADLARMAMLAQALPIAILGDLTCNSLARGAGASCRARGRRHQREAAADRHHGVAQDHRALRGGRHSGGDRDRFRSLASGRCRAFTCAWRVPSLADAPIETHFFDKLAGDAFAGEFGFADGAITPSDAPGFGAGLDRRALEKYSF